jgi:ankyrin repeat protein
LLEKGASMAPNARGRAALQAAASRGHAECVKLLAGAGADLDACDWRGSTALFEAATIGSRECVAELVAHGCDIEKRTKDYAMSVGMMCAMVGNMELLTLLVEAGIDVGAKDANGWMARDWAKAKGRRECLEYLTSLEERNALAQVVQARKGSKSGLRI